MPYDPARTRAAILAAAIDEFAELGLAGGRVDRIAHAAKANKRAIYDYFGSKEGLFDAAVTQVVDDLNVANPLREDDLVGYAANLFDYLHANPTALRMTTWWRLERPTLTAGLSPGWLQHLRAVDGQVPEPIGSVDLVILVIGLVNAWFLSGREIVIGATENPEDPQRLALHREAVLAAVQRLAGGAGPSSTERGGFEPPMD